MFPRQIATGVILLLVAIGGVVYVLALPKPRVETLQDEPLELRLSQPNQPVIVPSPEPQPNGVRAPSAQRRQVGASEPRRFGVVTNALLQNEPSVRRLPIRNEPMTNNVHFRV